MRADILTQWAARQGLTLTEEQMEQFARFQAHLLAVNTYMNLTAITDEADIAIKHFIDSLTVLPWLPPRARVIDVGTGAGFPGLPVKIARPDISLTLVDSLRKRVHFLQAAVDKLGLPSVTCLHARAEELSRKEEHRGQYAVGLSRAVARLDTLAGYVLPFVRSGGIFLAMKGPDVSDEVAEARPSLAKLGGTVTEIQPVYIAPDIRHTLVVVAKK